MNPAIFSDIQQKPKIFCFSIVRNIFLFIFASLKKSTLIVPLCNGSTDGFGPSSRGSNPCGTTSKTHFNFEVGLFFSVSHRFLNVSHAFLNVTRAFLSVARWLLTVSLLFLNVAGWFLKAPLVFLTVSRLFLKVTGDFP